MPVLPRLRHLGRLVLLWFALSLGAAIASPIVHPQALQLVCSSAGTVKVVVQSEEGVQPPGVGHLDCPLCQLPGGGLPPAPVLPLAAVAPADAAALAHPMAPRSRLAAAPLPARGPPALS